MKPRTSIATALSLQLLLFLAESRGNAGAPVPESGCDTTKNQESWYVNYRECGSQASQVSLLANISEPSVKGNQLSFFANVAMRDLEGVQLGGTFNYARHLRGAQISLDLNLARKVDGWQLSGMNIADSVKGAQIGFVNVARHLDGYGVGFLTLTGNGLLHLDAMTEETGMGSLVFATGQTLFTSYSFGYTIGRRSHPYSFGMGFGYHKAFGATYFEGELRGNLVLDKHTNLSDLEEGGKNIGESDWRHNTLVQAKLRLGHALFGGFGVFGGVSYNALVTHENGRLMEPWNDDLTSASEDVFCWPGLEIGIRFGR